MRLNFEREPSFEEPSEIQQEEKEKETKPHFDAIIVFGAGIREPKQENLKFFEKEAEKFLKEIPTNPTEDKEYLNWKKTTRELLTIQGKMRALGCLEILKEGEVDEVILTGGKTKGENLPSEAELMQHYIIQKYQEELLRKIRKKEITLQEAKTQLENLIKKIRLEDKATNTIENFALVINMMDENPQKYQRLAFLSNQYHLSRILKLAEKFLLQGEKRAAEEKLRERSKHYNRFLEKATSFDNPEYRKILQGEEKWSQALDKIPWYFLPQATFVNLERLKAMLRAHQDLSQALKEKGLTLEEILSMSPEERKKLREIPQ